MCMTKKELEAKVEEIRKYKAMIEEARGWNYTKRLYR